MCVSLALINCHNIASYFSPHGFLPNSYIIQGSVPPIGFAIICRQNHVVSYLLTHPKLDKSFSRLSSAIVISVKVGNQVCTNLLLDLFGGVERSLELAEQNYLPEVQQHIHEFMLLPEIEVSK